MIDRDFIHATIAWTAWGMVLMFAALTYIREVIAT